MRNRKEFRMDRQLFIDLIEIENDYLKIYVKEKGKHEKEAKYYYGNIAKLKQDMLDLVLRDFKGKEIEGSMARPDKPIVWKDLGKV